MTREAFHARLDALGDHAATTCVMTGQLLERATTALLAADAAAAGEVIADDSELTGQRTGTEQAVVQLLTLQAPVATDLRRLVSTLWIVGDLHRMGVLAIHVAHATLRRHPACVVPVDLRVVVNRMGRLGVDLAGQTAAVLRDRDVHAAAALATRDEEMNQLRDQVFAAVTDPSWRYGVTAGVDVALLGRCYERYADHAVTIGRRIVYLVTGDTAAERLGPRH